MVVLVIIQESGVAVGFGACLLKAHSFQFNFIKKSFVLEKKKLAEPRVKILVV
jgi:hypothetical protein